MSTLRNIAIAIGLSLIPGFFITDCSRGENNMEESIATSRRYLPERVWYTVHTDSDGHTHLTQHRDPAEWRVTFENGMDLNVGSGTYPRIKVGDRYFIAYRVGRWTGLRYLENVRPDLNTKGPIEGVQ